MLPDETSFDCPVCRYGCLSECYRSANKYECDHCSRIFELDEYDERMYQVTGEDYL